MAGYYIHFDPVSDNYFICGGLYNPTKEVIESVREQIMLEPDEFHKAVLACGEDFHLSWDSALKRFPRGYNETDKHNEYYQLKSYKIYKLLTKADVLKKDFLKNALTDLQKCFQLNELLNKCFDYAYDPER